MSTNFSSKPIEQQRLRANKKYHLAISEINSELIKVHKILERCIQKNTHIAATTYVDQYISYTSIWNIKFVYNLENPEVVLMQLFHLEYILTFEKAEQLEPLRRAVAEQQQKFKELKPYPDEQIQLRKEKMLAFIETYADNK